PDPELATPLLGIPPLGTTEPAPTDETDSMKLGRLVADGSKTELIDGTGGNGDGVGPSTPEGGTTTGGDGVGISIEPTGTEEGEEIAPFGVAKTSWIGDADIGVGTADIVRAETEVHTGRTVGTETAGGRETLQLRVYYGKEEEDDESAEQKGFGAYRAREIRSQGMSSESHLYGLHRTHDASASSTRLCERSTVTSSSQE
ncbi:MAG: hypothetical protein Q9214_007945, partial [Letrouitia sp. 1 TL-2023]